MKAWIPENVRREALDYKPKLPEPRRITRYVADVCRRCGCVHTTEFESAQCREQAREQL